MKLYIFFTAFVGESGDSSIFFDSIMTKSPSGSKDYYTAC